MTQRHLDPTTPPMLRLRHIRLKRCVEQVVRRLEGAPIENETVFTRNTMRCLLHVPSGRSGGDTDDGVTAFWVESNTMPRAQGSRSN